MDGVFLGLARLLLGIFLGLRPWNIPRSSPASPWKTPSIPPLLLGLTEYITLIKIGKKKANFVLTSSIYPVTKEKHFPVAFSCTGVQKVGID